MVKLFAHRNLALLIIGTSIMFLGGCNLFKKRTAPKAGVYLINVLDKEFFDDCHIPGSLNVSMMEFEKEAQNWEKTVPVVVYCSNYSCEASTHCCKLLEKMGFTQVWDYEEGMTGWYQAHLKDSQAYPIEGPGVQPYLTMENMPLAQEGMTKKIDVKTITTADLKALIDRSAS